MYKNVHTLLLIPTKRQLDDGAPGGDVAKPTPRSEGFTPLQEHDECDVRRALGLAAKPAE